MSEPEPLLWNVEQSHQDLHDVINRLAVKPADEVSKEDIQEANELRNHHVGISTGRICGQYNYGECEPMPMHPMHILVFGAPFI